MHILISNDDGIHAQGIHALAQALHAAGHRVTVCAPDCERSASGHGLTLHTPLHASPIHTYPQGITAWSITGTPVDCVRLGLTALADAPVDLVVSGINHGPNLGSDTIYSGTVAAAMEAVLLDHPALAVSLGGRNTLAFLPTAAAWACRVAAWLHQRGLTPLNVYNLNVPPLPESDVKGIRAAPLARLRYTNGYTYSTDQYHLSSRPDGDDIPPDSDAALLKAGYITLTPLTWSMLDHAALESIHLLEGGL